MITSLKNPLAISLKRSKRGRPRIEKPTFDRGTPERQHMRHTYLQAFANLDFKNESPLIFAAESGSQLHQLKLENKITDEQFQAGIDYGKLAFRAYQSMGISWKISSVARRWLEDDKGNSKPFESKHIERKWRILCDHLRSHYGPRIKSTLDFLIFTPHEKDGSIRQNRHLIIYALNCLMSAEKIKFW